VNTSGVSNVCPLVYDPVAFVYVALNAPGGTTMECPGRQLPYLKKGSYQYLSWRGFERKRKRKKIEEGIWDLPRTGRAGCALTGAGRGGVIVDVDEEGEITGLAAVEGIDEAVPF
jgi:hypothetical protein